MKQFTRVTNDLSKLSKIVNASKRDRIIRKEDVKPQRVVSRTAIVRAKKIRGLK